MGHSIPPNWETPIEEKESGVLDTLLLPAADDLAFTSETVEDGTRELPPPKNFELTPSMVPDWNITSFSDFTKP